MHMYMQYILRVTYCTLSARANMYNTFSSAMETGFLPDELLIVVHFILQSFFVFNKSILSLRVTKCTFFFAQDYSGSNSA